MSSTTGSPFNLSPVPPLQLGDQAQGFPANNGNDYAHENVASPDGTTTIIQYHNHNHGRGVVNHVRGNQQIHMNISLSRNTEPSLLCDTSPVIEPYQTEIESLVDITQVLSELPQSRTVLTQREQLESFLGLVVCTAKAIEIIRGNSPKLETITFFSDVDRQARKLGKSLEQLRVDIGDFRDQIFDQMETGSGATHDWPSLRTRLDTLIQDSQAPLKELLSILLNPESRHIMADKYGELRGLVAHSGLIPKFDIHHFEVHTIWIQDPVGCNMYAIPLSLCTTWRDVSLLIGQYFREGPVSHYIRGGDWKMVRVDDNRVIEARSFVDAMKAEAIFDIGIILHRLKRKGIACPQCGQDDSENTVSTEEWVRCSVKMRKVVSLRGHYISKPICVA